MSKRLQVVMDDAEYQEIQDVAAAHRLTASAWVRGVLREARQATEDVDAPAPDPSPPTPAAPSEDDASSVLSSPDDRTLVEAVMRRHGFSSAREAVRYALRRAAEPPMLRQDLMALRGMGWVGDAGDADGRP